MPGKHVALIRGINVGKAKRVQMADLRALFETLGFSEPRTLLNSGNVVFGAAGSGPIAPKIEKAMAASLGVSARVMTVSAKELATIMAENPLRKAEADASHLLIAVPTTAADRRRLDPLLAQKWAPEALAIGSRAAYIHCPGGIIDSKLVAAAQKLLKDDVTMRNWATMTKLRVMVEEK